MAATTAGARLTEAHRLAQARIGARTVLALRAVFKLLDPADIDGTFEDWLQGVMPVIRSQRTTSARLAANYLTTFRTLELGADVEPYVPVLADEVAEDAVKTSMLVTGPVSLRSNLAKAVPLVRAISIAEANSARAGMRHALGGGRDTIDAAVEADSKALGWSRTTSGRACGFCAMLASRGPVYKTEASAARRADGRRYHDGCHCGTEPAYRPDADWPAGAREYRALWDSTTRGLSGSDALNAFRLAVEGR